MLLGRWAGQQSCSAPGKCLQNCRMEPHCIRAKPSQIFRVCGRGWPSHPLQVLFHHTDQPLCLPRLESLCFPSPVKSFVIKSAGLQCQIPGIPSPFAGSSGWEALTWGFRTFTRLGEPLWYCSPVCGSPTQWSIGFDFIVITPSNVPSHYLSSSLDVVSSSGRFQLLSVVVAGCVWHLPGGDERMSCYPAILNRQRIRWALGHSAPLAKLIVYIKPQGQFHK